MRFPNRIIAALAVALTTALVASSCTATKPAPPAATSITVTWLAYRSDGTGTTGKTVITKKAPKKAGDFRVDFSANEVGGIGSASQAGAWDAAIISTLLLSQPLEGDFSFETDGFIDGPSAGALTTAGLIALARGEKFKKNITMTGTINSTGTLGPVGGIPEKIQGAADAKLTTVLIPLGQRNSVDHKGNSVDVVREGERLGVTVIEVGDIYEAYEHLTGHNIDVPGVKRDPRLSDAAYDKVKPQTDAALARYNDAQSRFGRLPQQIQALFAQAGLIPLAEEYATKAADLQRQGLQAGAFQFASQAAALYEAVASVGDMITPLMTQGLDGLSTIFAQAVDTSTAEKEFRSFLDRLAAYQPKSVSDTEGLVHGFSGAFDAYSLLMFAQGQVKAISDNWNRSGYSSIDQLFADLTQPVLWGQLARSQITTAEAVFEVGRDNPGAKISKAADLQQLGDFFRRGSDANFAAFKESVVAPLAEAHGMSQENVLDRLADVDLNVALALSQSQVQPAIANYIGGKKPNSKLATLAYGLNNYVRNQALLDKYYNNAQLDDSFAIVGVPFEAVLTRTLDLGRQQLAAEVTLLGSHHTQPVVSVGGLEVASMLREGSVSDKFDASSLYQGGFLTTRMMAYLAGIIPAKAK